MNLLSSIFPTRCIVCSKIGNLTCTRCYKKAFRRSIPECYVCRKISKQYSTHEKCLSPETLTSMVYLWTYNKSAKQLMHQLKYSGSFDLFNELGQLISERLNELPLPFSSSDTYLFPIPNHTWRNRERGYNHTSLLAHTLRQIIGIPFAPEVCKRSVYTPHLAGKRKHEREKMIQKVFLPTPTLHMVPKGATLLIIDDVITTGSTINSLAHTIKKARKDISLHGLALFRGRAYYSDRLDEKVQSFISKSAGSPLR